MQKLTYQERHRRIRRMWFTGRFMYWCKRCHNPFQSWLLWIEAYCPIDLWGRLDSEQPEFYVINSVYMPQKSHIKKISPEKAQGISWQLNNFPLCLEYEEGICTILSFYALTPFGVVFLFIGRIMEWRFSGLGPTAEVVSPSHYQKRTFSISANGQRWGKGLLWMRGIASERG